jgi:transcriptional regulator with XRE-family HTH domain
VERFSDNLVRLMGLHALPAKEAAAMLGMSQSTFSKWASGTRQPSFTTALIVGEFFGVPADRLARAEFADLLANELSSPERYESVEAEIRRRRIYGVPKKVVAINEAGERRQQRTKKRSPERG